MLNMQEKRRKYYHLPLLALCGHPPYWCIFRIQEYLSQHTECQPVYNSCAFTLQKHSFYHTKAMLLPHESYAFVVRKHNYYTTQ